MRVNRVAVAILPILLAATSVRAQERQPMSRSEMNKYVISAKAGVVNLVVGDAKVVRHRPFALPEMLLSSDELQNGDIVKTGSSGRVEVLLNPGCYLRVGSQSEFV